VTQPTSEDMELPMVWKINESQVNHSRRNFLLFALFTHFKSWVLFEEFTGEHEAAQECANFA
jgi:hypothetical protein